MKATLLLLALWTLLNSGSAAADYTQSEPERAQVTAELELTFLAYDSGDKGKRIPAIFYIHSPGRSFEFIEIGKKLPFRPRQLIVTEFQIKHALDANKKEVDVSDITLTDVLTKERFILPLNTKVKVPYHQ